MLRRIWQLGMDSSQVMALSQVLLDSIGPRLTGTPGIEALYSGEATMNAWAAANRSRLAAGRKKWVSVMPNGPVIRSAMKASSAIPDTFSITHPRMSVL